MFLFRARGFSTPAAFLLIGAALILTIVLAWQVYELERNNQRHEFAQRADVRLRAIEEGVDAMQADLFAVGQLLIASPGTISGGQFHRFTRPARTRAPYIRYIAFHRHVRHADRAAYEERVRQRLPGFAITEAGAGASVPAARRQAYLVQEYVAPRGATDRAIGLDRMSDPRHAAAIGRAVDQGLPVTSVLAQHADDAQLTVFVPLYREGAGTEDAAARWAALVGVVEADISAAGFLGAVLRSAGFLNTPEYHIHVSAPVAGVGHAKVYGFAPQPQSPGAGWLDAARHSPASMHMVREIAVAGQPWQVEVRATSVARSPYYGALAALLPGLVFTFAMAWYLYLARRRTGKIERLVQERTAELQAATEALALRTRAIEASANPIIITAADNPDFTIEYVNPAFERVTGHAAAEVLGKPLHFLGGGNNGRPGIADVYVALEGRQAGHAIVQAMRRDGSTYWNDVYVAPVPDESGHVGHMVLVNYDVTETIRYQEELEIRANYDALTGLANRNLLRDRLGQAILQAGRDGSALYVACLDLDGFRFVNDSVGHQQGDFVLATAAQRLNAATRATDTIARIGGDKFVLVIQADDPQAAPIAVIERAMAAIAAPVAVQGKNFFITCSIGIAVSPGDGQSTDTLLAHAEIAMYRAKELGRNNYQFFEAAMNAKTLERLQIEGGLREALANGELFLHYQPQVDLRTGDIVGAEALLRWNHPELGTVSPARFIPLAEETALIVPIGEWVLRSACAQGKAWQAAGRRKLRIAVNLSAVQFARPDIVDTIAAILKETGFEPCCLDIEITEGIVMNNVERAVEVLRSLKALGVQLSIDDFGTGYSSLAYLKKFPIDVLKVDQSFVRDLARGRQDAMIVGSIIALARNLNLHVIAEGVETVEQLAYLKERGCDEVQGYYFSPPVEAEVFEQMLELPCRPRGPRRR